MIKCHTKMPYLIVTLKWSHLLSYGKGIIEFYAETPNKYEEFRRIIQ